MDYICNRFNPSSLRVNVSNTLDLHRVGGMLKTPSLLICTILPTVQFQYSYTRNNVTCCVHNCQLQGFVCSHAANYGTLL